jgi:hypothetical protein
LGSYQPEFVFSGLPAFSRYFRRKMLKGFSFFRPRVIHPLINLPSIKRAGRPRLCPDQTENLILFNHLPA